MDESLKKSMLARIAAIEVWEKSVNLVEFTKIIPAIIAEFRDCKTNILSHYQLSADNFPGAEQEFQKYISAYMSVVSKFENDSKCVFTNRISEKKRGLHSDMIIQKTREKRDFRQRDIDTMLTVSIPQARSDILFLTEKIDRLQGEWDRGMSELNVLETQYNDLKSAISGGM